MTTAYYPPTNGRQSGRPPSKRRESQTQGIKSRRCSKCSKVGHTRRTCRNPRADFDANYEVDVVEVEDLLDGSYIPKFSAIHRQVRPRNMEMVQTSFETVVYAFYCDPTPTPVCVLMIKYSFTCSCCQITWHVYPTAGKCSPCRETLTFCSYWLRSYHHTPTPVCILMCKYIGVCTLRADMFTPVCVLMMKHGFACFVLSSKLAYLPSRRQMFTVVNHSLQLVNPWGTDKLQP
ncbi:hypothetical protein Cgig2_012247 [Carnegiea gigantea]|uniref:CCHC-type domain-containing protein n=1 Tax=Carnegiea gigantea TaxID=171969 RepID=A0A9Q1JPU2_9CARY|nr:hypothetical protein Cgig2_012247 [Carnegiea gigantea]